MCVTRSLNDYYGSGFFPTVGRSVARSFNNLVAPFMSTGVWAGAASVGSLPFGEHVRSYPELLQLSCLDVECH